MQEKDLFQRYIKELSDLQNLTDTIKISAVIDRIAQLKIGFRSSGEADKDVEDTMANSETFNRPHPAKQDGSIKEE